MSQFASSIDLADLNGTNGYRIYATIAGDYAGISVSSADINGDGISDAIIAAPKGHDVYVVFGGTTSLAGFDTTDLTADGAIHLDPSKFDGSNAFMIDSIFPTGFLVAGVGDWNGDAVADFLIGGLDSVLILAGSNGPIDPVYDDGDLNTIFANGDGYFISGDSGFGAALSAGDINHDGVEDFIFGQPSAPSFPGPGPSGTAWVVFGGSASLAALDAADGTVDSFIDVANVDGTTGFSIAGGNYTFGSAVDGVGDVNGDGYEDFLIGDYQDDTAYLMFGSATPAGAAFDVASLNGTNGYKFVAPSSLAGISVSSAGDVNGDGRLDLLIGASGINGAIVVYGGSSLAGFDAADGSADGVIDLSAVDSAHGFIVHGGSSVVVAGVNVSNAGDVNGDGFDDLLVGTNYEADTDVAFVVFGSANGPAGGTISADDLDGNNGFVIARENAGDLAGTAVSAAGDMNGDGFADILVGAYYSDAGASHAGAAYIIFGHMPDEAVTRLGTHSANTIHGSDFGDTLRGGFGDDTLYGHGGNDLLAAGIGNDTLVGGGGADRLRGGLGADTFVYASASDSTGPSHDTVREFDFTGDAFDIATGITGIDTTIGSGQLRGGHFDADLAAAADATHLAADHAVLFTPDSGNKAGKTFLIVDLNGTDGYQAGADLVINLVNPQNLASLDSGDFI